MANNKNMNSDCGASGSGISISAFSGCTVPGSAVTVRPLLQSSQVQLVSPPIAQSPQVMRKINVAEICTCLKLKALIRNQLQGDVTEKYFEVGYLQGTTVAEVWGNLQHGSNVTLLCDGLKVRNGAPKKKQAQEIYSDEEDSPLSKRRREDEDRVQKIVEDLKRGHGEKFTTMQYRIWAEMKKSGVHDSTFEPPTTSMFTHACGSTSGSFKKILLKFLLL